MIEEYLFISVSPVVKCSPTQMRIEVPISLKTRQVYIQGLRDYPDMACRPHTDQAGSIAVFDLGLDDVYRCAVTRAVSAQMVSKRKFFSVYLISLKKRNSKSTLA